MIDDIIFVLKDLLGIDPPNLLRRMLFGGLVILISGFLSFGAIFYSFFYAINSATVLCVLPEETTNIISSFFMFPILIVALYMSLVAAVIYYVNPWEKLKS